MSAFNFIESFFLLSLGITFVLIVLLVYHFKQKLSTMEQKCDTMFDIVQNLVQEFKTVKQQCCSMPMPMQASCPMSMSREFVGSEVLRNVCDNEEDEDEEDEDEDEEDEDDEDEDEDEDEDDEDEDEDEDEKKNVKIINMSESTIDEILPEAPVVAIDYKKQTVAELRVIVTTRGLATNPSRLSKTDLLKLLEK